MHQLVYLILIISIIQGQVRALTQFESILIAGSSVFGGLILLFIIMLVVTIIVIQLRISYRRWGINIQKIKEYHERRRNKAAKRIQRWYREQIFLRRRRIGARKICLQILEAKKEYKNKINLIERNWVPFTLNYLQAYHDKVQLVCTIDLIRKTQALFRKTRIQYNLDQIYFDNQVDCLLHAELRCMYPKNSTTYKHNFQRLRSNYIIENYWNAIQWIKDPIEEHEFRPVLFLEGRAIYFSKIQLNQLRERYREQLIRKKEIACQYDQKIRRFQSLFDIKKDATQKARFFQSCMSSYISGAIARFRLRKQHQAALKIQKWFIKQQKGPSTRIDYLWTVLIRDVWRRMKERKLHGIKENAVKRIQLWYRSIMFIKKIREHRLKRQLEIKNKQRIGSTLYYHS
mmetsp:Transcript_8612/g.12707  ORF Transcript_8612/g.12707 Transcript_8612/m.12707 type:complete len:401 (-) Transcript_8612:474-1676(-)